MSSIKDDDNSGEDNILESQDSLEEEATENQENDNESPEVFEAKAEDLTGADPKGPASLGRRKILMFVACAFVAVIMLGLIFSGGGRRRGGAAAPDGGFIAVTPRDFLRSEMERSLRTGLTDADFDATDQDEFSHLFNDWTLPPQQQVVVQQLPPQQPQRIQPQQQAGRQPQPELSPLVPRVEGLFIGQAVIPPPITQPQRGVGAPPMSDAELMAMFAGDMQMPAMPDFSQLAALAGMGMGSPHQQAAQMAQQNREQFANVDISGDFLSGAFLPHNVLWVGTIIPAVLVNAINSDLPGNVLARVTSNVFDSQTGTALLIPQGTLLVATYNSSVSHGQRRVQISWDLLIRPDGFMMQLGGMNAVDQRGMAGLPAIYRENWFEYLKAAGIISAFSIINATMADHIGRFGGSQELQLGVLTANQEFIRDIGGNLVSRAMNIQPTLTVNAGERINIMTNRNMFLPPLERFPVTQRYRLTRR